MRVAFGVDESVGVGPQIPELIARLGHEVEVVTDASPWPEVGRRVGEAVASGEADMGVVCCWTGTGVSIAANKVPGIRAALCLDAETARGARRWNDANVLAIGLRLTSEAAAEEMLVAFFATSVDEGEVATVRTVEPASGVGPQADTSPRAR